jgi:adenylate kinase family enzyme
MKKFLITGNSGSGKTSLARRIQRQLGIAHLDLDTLAWLPDTPPRRRQLADSEKAIKNFIQLYEYWVIEGCYADLLELLVHEADEIVYLKVSESSCVANARRRPFEPEKYSCEAAQNANLEMLVQWINAYATRTDTCSLDAHEKLVESFPGIKTVLGSSEEIDCWSPD